MTAVLEVEPTRIGRIIRDLSEWLADPATPQFVSRTAEAYDLGDARYYPDPNDPSVQYQSVTWLLGRRNGRRTSSGGTRGPARSSRWTTG